MVLLYYLKDSIVQLGYLVSCMDQGHTLHIEHGGGANPQFVIPPWPAINQYLPPFRGGGVAYTPAIYVF